MRSIRTLALAVLLSASAPTVALARLTPAEYRGVGVSVPQDARLPTKAAVTDQAGHKRQLLKLVSRPTVLVFADYTCATLCGPILSFVGAALQGSGVTPTRFQLLVVGLDPKDSAADALAMRRDHIASPALDAVTEFLTADAATITALTAALGYRYAYDAEHDTYVHPGAAYVLTADGRASRALTGLGLSGADMRLALVEASRGEIGTVRDRIRLLCSAFDPLHGRYNAMVSRVLAVTGAATMLALGGTIVLLILLGGRAPAHRQPDLIGHEPGKQRRAANQ